MKRSRVVKIATWMVEHFSFGLNNRALAGDLLEELQEGRSHAWLWRQVCSAIAAGALSRIRNLGAPLLFCVAWSSLYSGWRHLSQSMLVHTAQGGSIVQVWPYSALLRLGLGMAPPLTFVWLGFLIYVLLRPASFREVSAVRLLGGLSASLNVILVSTLPLLAHFRQSRVDLDSLMREDFYSALHLLSVSVPIALSLFAALLSTVLRTPRIVRRRRTSRLQPLHETPHIIGLLCCVVVLSRPISVRAQAAGNPPTAQLVSVDQDVKLEVLDWGGTGRPLIFLAGLGNDAHAFDSFAPKFTDRYHVYGITRRGFGASSKPAPNGENYAADRLGDDVLAVMSALQIERPILVGHSLAGEELSSVGSRYPAKVAGLIYLDAGYGYAYYDKLHGDTVFDFFQLKKQLDAFTAGQGRDPEHSIQQISEDVASFHRDLEDAGKRDASVPQLHPPSAAIPPIGLAINLGGRRYANIPVPVLAIFACPHNFDFDRALRNDPSLKAQVVADDAFTTSRQADAFAKGVPTAHVVRLANADHYVFRSNEADVIREMNAFLSGLH